MVFPIVIFIRDKGYIGIRHILFTELPDQVVVQVSSYSHRITIIINQRYTETIDISRSLRLFLCGDQELVVCCGGTCGIFQDVG